MFAKDKIGHFLAGMILCVFFGMIFSSLAGVFVAVAVGVAKEIIDHFTCGNMEFNDFLATLVGALSGYFLLIG